MIYTEKKKGKVSQMKRLFRKIREVVDSFREDQSGIGVVEIILILVKIFTGKSVCISCI